VTRGQFVSWVAKPAVFAVLLVPLGLLSYDALTGGLSANPIEDLLHRTGRWGLKILILSLAMTPLRRVTGWSILVRFRRMIGLFAFFYLCLHFSIYLGLDQFFSLSEIVADVAKRPYITVGFVTLMLLVPLAITSTKRMVKWMGGKRWTRLHSLVYVAAFGGFLHFLWAVKADTRDPTVYGLALALLLAARLPLWRKQPGSRRVPA
jgi:sulfoxide reductase heme-binding subunit YedZ